MTSFVSRRYIDASSVFGVHHTDILRSERGKLVYVFNVKAGSSMIRSWLMRALEDAREAAPQVPERRSAYCNASFCDQRQACVYWPFWRFSTGCLGSQHEDFFRFSVVRDPVHKFESGVRQAWIQQPILRNLSADAMLQLVLTRRSNRRPGRSCCWWLDDHLQPSSYRLSGIERRAPLAHARPIRLDFVGKLEDINQSILELLQRWPPLRSSLKQKKMLSRLPKAQQPTLSDPRMIAWLNARPGQGSTLSPSAICAMCRSFLYGNDFILFNYTLSCPEGCSLPSAAPQMKWVSSR